MPNIQDRTFRTQAVSPNAFSTKEALSDDSKNIGASILSSTNSAEEIAHKDALIERAAKEAAGAEEATDGKEAMAGAPLLRLPTVTIDAALCQAIPSALGDIRDNPELASWIEKTQANPAFIKGMEALRASATGLPGDAPQSVTAGFNIMNVSSQPTDLLLSFLLLMLQSRIADAKFNSAMTINNAAAVGKTGDSLRSEGLKQALGGIFGGLITITGGAVGAGLKATGQFKARQNQKNVVEPMMKRQAETKTMNDRLPGDKGGVKGDELKVNVKDPDGSDKTVSVAPHNQELSAENEATISEAINAKNDILNQGDMLANHANLAAIDKWNLAGEIFAVGGGIGSLVSTGVQADVKKDQADQQISGLDARVAGQGGDDARDKAKALIGLINEMLQAMVTFYQSRNGTNSAIVGNFRA